ncbi:MAG: orc1/cdc6 family replication initiation protein [Candidatus Woesearchaeota archaeon]
MNISDFFEKYLSKDSIFQDKSVLLPSYIPEVLDHRQKEIEYISKVLAPALKFSKISNLFIYGKTGTGKTVSIKYVQREMEKIAKLHKIPIEIIYTNCKIDKLSDTEYRILAYLLSYFNKKVPSTGIPTQTLYQSFFEILEKRKLYVILILDEVDQIIQKSGDELLYILLRKNEELQNSYLSIVGISNNLNLTNQLDPRIKSSLSEESIIFEPYNALQLKDILLNRAKRAFKPGVLEPGLIEKCAAYAAREHGDARRAIDLLRLAGELAERDNSSTVTMKHLDLAQEKMESDKYFDAIKSQPRQYQAVLYSILEIKEKQDKVFTGDVYNVYYDVAKRSGLRPLTQRRVSDILNEFDSQGILSVKIISQGRYGRTRDIEIAIPPLLQPVIKSLLSKELNLE